MEPDKILLLTFSPTRTSKRIGEAIARGFSGAQTNVIDLSHDDDPTLPDITAGTLIIISVPVYGGLAAPAAIERMDKLQANGAPCVIVAVYGNRAYDQALNQLSTFTTGHGGKVIAAGAFVGEHSYSNGQYPIAAGRPDRNDLEEAEIFGQKIRQKIAAADNVDEIAAIDTEQLPDPAMSDATMLQFRSDVQETMKRQAPGNPVPTTDSELCTHCGTCALHCPTQAIRKGDECHTDASKCIKCCACVKICPQQARTYETPFSALLNKYFSTPKRNITLI